MAEKEQKTLSFLRKNAYYFIFIACLTVLAIITVALVVSKENSVKQVDGGKEIINPINDKPEEPENPETPEDPSEKEDPVSKVIIFDLPVQGSILKEYVSAGVVYNQTLGLYSGHKAVDFSANEGTEVFACYKGVIENIETSKLNGTTVTVDHGNGLKSIYNSIEADDNLFVGKNVENGDLLGTVSLNNRTEYKDGAHLHFEVTENGVKVDPFKYLLTEEK